MHDTFSPIDEIIDEIGLPEGVVNMVHGSVDVVNGILDHPDIEGVSFVGSTPTARSTSISVATPITVEYTDTRSSRGSPRPSSGRCRRR